MIGPFRVLARLGEGGMGEVYRARDTRLQREVAIKLLPPSLSADPDRLARFHREAQLLASINHPHIGAIYGVEDVQGNAALVLELVEGPTLADRIAQGPLPVDEVVAIALQIAAALEAAHEQGIIHRDLKPANIKLRPDGTVKVLDFGLARADGPAAAPGDVAASPTFTAHDTAAGLILGTAAYMAPEQARGRPVDRRADIWAFGVVLFEMVTGTRPFGGETISETLAAIIKDQPSWAKLPAGLPVRLQELLQRTLEKDPRRRLRDIGDARLVLEDQQSGAGATVAPAVSPSGRAAPRMLPWAVASIATLAAVFLGWRTATQQAAPDLPSLKYTLPITGESLERTALPAISPDGRHIVFARGGSLWIRSLDQLEPRQLAGTTGAQFPFWSPDSRQVAYLTASSLWRAGLDGSPPTRIANYNVSKGGRTPGGAWLADGMIVFAAAGVGTGLVAVPASGGEFRDYYRRDPTFESDFHRPSVLPDGRSLVFVVHRTDTGSDTIGVLANGVRKDVLRLENEFLDSPVYSPTGHLLYHRDTTTPGIWALPFSVDRLEATGQPFLVAAQASFPSIAADGTLIYADGSISGLTSLAWLNLKTGAVTPAFNERFTIVLYPRLSPDGTRVAALVQSVDRGFVLIVADLARQTHVRIADRAEGFSRPAWRDNRTVLFQRTHGPGRTIVLRAADGSGDEVTVTEGLDASTAAGRLVFSRLALETRGDLYSMLLPPGTVPPGSPERLQQQLAAHDVEPALSPDGTLLVYSSGDAGQTEVILRTFPSQTAQWQVSSAGGSNAVWSPLGDAIYYRDLSGQIMRVAVRTTPAMTLGAPTVVPRPWSLVARAGFDVSSDGTRLLVVEEVKTDEQRRASLAVVQNWLASIKR